MSDTRTSLRDSLLAFLDNPKEFMTSNIVLPPAGALAAYIKNPDTGFSGPVSATGSGIFQFTFEKSDKVGKRANNEDCPRFFIGTPSITAAVPPPRFNAYYCHYKDDKTFDLMLPAGGDVHLMLTPTMNGCSFGVGSATDTGARRVAHANVFRTESTAEGIKQQGVTQASNLGQVIDNPTIIGPSDYVDKDVYGTTVGVWRDGGWSFFMQVWKRPTPTSYILDRIIDIA